MAQEQASDRVPVARDLTVQSPQVCLVTVASSPAGRLSSQADPGLSGAWHWERGRGLGASSALHLRGNDNTTCSVPRKGTRGHGSTGTLANV